MSKYREPKVLRNEQDVLDFFGAVTRRDCERAVYKATECGAWIQFFPEGIRLGSIVEGSDAEVSTDPLFYPFTEASIEETLEYIEGEAAVLWDEANGGEQL